MLILTRRVGEQILIDKGQIQIKIIYERNGVIAIGIQAPPHVDVDRKEIFMRKLVNPEPQRKLSLCPQPHAQYWRKLASKE